MKILPLLHWRLHQHIHTHTLDTQFPRFAFQIAYWHSPSFPSSFPLLLLFSPTRMPSRHWFYSIPFNIPHHQETQGCFKKKIYIYRGKKWGKGEKEKRERKECMSAQTPLPRQHAHGLPFARCTSMPLILRSYFPWSEPIKDFQPLWREQYQITLDSLVNSCLPGSGSIFYLTL